MFKIVGGDSIEVRPVRLVVEKEDVVALIVAIIFSLIAVLVNLRW